MATMNTYEIRKGVFAMGTTDRRAVTVVKKAGAGFVGIRGQRPVLSKGRFTRIKPSKELRAALAAA